MSKKDNGAMTVTVLQAGGDWSVWMNHHNSDMQDAFLIGCSEIAEGGTQESALQNAADLLQETLFLVSQFQTNRNLSVDLTTISD